MDIRRSTSGYIFFLAEGDVSWKYAKQTLVDPSTTIVEFVACFKALNHVTWLWNTVTCLHVIGIIQIPFNVYCDNSLIMFYSNNNMSYTKSKIINIKYFIVKERAREKYILIEHIGINLILVDPPTKSLTPKTYHGHV